MTHGGDPAFPSSNGYGLTKREFIAAQIVAGCTSKYSPTNMCWDNTAANAVKLADALLVELAK